MVGQFAVCLSAPKSHASWHLVLLVGAPMPDRSKGRGQMKSDPLGLEVQVGVQGY